MVGSVHATHATGFEISSKLFKKRDDLKAMFKKLDRTSQFNWLNQEPAISLVG